MNISIHLGDLKAFWVAFIVSAILSKPILSLLIKAKSRQTVSSHLEGHAAKQGTPTMGGFIILVGLFAGFPFGMSTTHSMVLVITMALFAFIGFVDDYVVPRLMVGKRGLGWKQKIILQVLAALLPMLVAGGAGSLDIVLLGAYVFSVLFFANAFNFADGLDGLAGTILLGSLIGMIGIPAVYGAVMPSGILFSLLGGLVVFLFWNAPKARVFMGDVGSLPIGALLGGYWFFIRTVGSLSSEEPDPRAVAKALLLPLLIWSIPMICELVPVPLQVFSVKVFKKKLFPFTPIHHAFEEIKLKAGETEDSASYLERVQTSPRWARWPETRIVFTFALFQLLCSLLAITVAIWTKVLPEIAE